MCKIALMQGKVRQLALESQRDILQTISIAEVWKTESFSGWWLVVNFMLVAVPFVEAFWTSSLTVSVLAISLLSPRSFQCAAPTGVDEYHKHQHNYVYNRNPPPVGFHILQHTSSTWIAVETQLSLGIAPSSAVRVGAPRSPYPGCSIVKSKLTFCGWLAASRLKKTSDVPKSFRQWYPAQTSDQVSWLRLTAYDTIFTTHSHSAKYVSKFTRHTSRKSERYNCSFINSSIKRIGLEITPSDLGRCSVLQDNSGSLNGHDNDYRFWFANT